MNRIIKKICVGILVIVSGYFIIGSIFPGLLWRETFGITYTEDDYTSIINKLSSIKLDIEQNKENIEYEFSSEELTSYLNNDATI